ncbi:MAG: hypothetical protein ACP5I1_07195, partial [Candidatus Hinthialibacter sp.]
MMKRRQLFSVLAILTMAATSAVSVENLDRGLTAMEQPDGSVFISWRLFQEDPDDISFLLIRRDRSDPASFVDLPLPLNGGVTSYVDRAVENKKTYEYILFDKRTPTQGIEKT